MTCLVGIDFSTRSIHGAIIPLDPTSSDIQLAMFRTADLPRSSDVATRCRAVRLALRDWWRYATPRLPGWDVTSAWVEEPIGPHRGADRALLPILGAILSATPTATTAATITTLEWRRVLDLPLRMTKDQAILAAVDAWDTNGATNTPPPTHHHAEAYLIALAGRTLCWKHAA